MRWTADTLALVLPMYLANVLHLSIELNGYINALSTALFALFSFLAAYAFSEISKSNNENNNNNHNDNTISKQRKFNLRNLSKTNLRKIAQSIASFGSAIAIFLMCKYACNLPFSISMLLVVSCCLVMGTGGELQIPYDMTAIYPGTLHGLACALSISGWLAPSLIGLSLGQQQNSLFIWSLVWYITATINFIGGLVFVLFADASPREFRTKIKRKSAKLNNIANDNSKPTYVIDRTFNDQHVNYHNEFLDTDIERNFHEPFRETKFSNQSQTNQQLHDIPETDRPKTSCEYIFDNDTKRVKIRQPDNCFIQSTSYLSGLDSLPATLVPMFPYKTRPDKQNKATTNNDHDVHDA